MNVNCLLKTTSLVVLLFLLTCVFHLNCTCSGMVQEDEWWGDVTFIGDEEHYAVIRHYKKFTTGTSTIEYNGEVLETKSTVFIKNARTGDSKKIFETPGQIANFLPCLPDTAISFVGGGQGHVYKYTGELITNFKGSGVMGGWTMPYEKYITNENGTELIEKDWKADTFKFIAYTNYSFAQPWGILNSWGGYGGRVLLKNDTMVSYNSTGIFEKWINRDQIIGHTSNNAYDSNFVVMHDFLNDSNDTIYFLGEGRSSGYATVNSNASILITSKLKIIDLTINKE